MTGGDPATATVETFPALDAISGVRHGFTGRAPGLDVKADRALALERLDASHAAARRNAGLESRVFITAEQVHGSAVVVVNSATMVPVANVDGLITADPAVCLGIYVADCCAVYLADPRRRVIGLLHSGRRGSESGIAAAAIEQMRTDFGCDPADMIAQLSPCIRPPNYEVDFAAMIVAQCREAGIRQVADSGVCTGVRVDRYYSYRIERGKTGRMLAFLALF
jgi:copper oxidase (laccase) domain-containing protein